MEDPRSWHVDGIWVRFPCTTVFFTKLACRYSLEDLNLLKVRRPSKMEWMNIRAAFDAVDGNAKANFSVREQ